MNRRGTFQAYIDALNRHDIDELLSFYADDFTFELEQSGATLSRDELRAAFGWDAVMDGQYAVEVVRERGDTLTVLLTERNAFYHALGVDHVSMEVVYVFEDGRITKQILKAVKDGSERYAEALDQLRAWMLDTHPDAWEALTDDSQLVYTAETARWWLSILEEGPTSAPSKK